MSVLGSNEYLHNKLVYNDTAFNNTIKGLKKALELNIGVSVNTTLTRYNYKDIDNIIRLLSNLGVKNFSITRYIHTDFSRRDTLSLNVDEFNNVLYKLINCKIKDFNFRVSNCFPLCVLDTKLLSVSDIIKKVAPCDGGKSWIAIDYEGNIMPCPSFRYKCGNILHDDLATIWKDNQQLCSIRNNELCPQKCKKCKYIEICGGGCKACSITSTAKS